MKHTRQEAKALGLPTCYGSLCKKHPTLEGLRRVSGACVECARENTRKRRLLDPQKYKEQSKKHSTVEWQKILASPELHNKKKVKSKEYYRKNKAKIRAGIVKWSRENLDKVKHYAKKVKKSSAAKVNFYTAKRRAARLQRTPNWLTEDDRWMIKEAYELATVRTKIFGFPWHVDHVIPLQGTVVSGLHVPLNLQVIPGAMNDAKGNKYEVQF